MNTLGIFSHCYLLSTLVKIHLPNPSTQTKIKPVYYTKFVIATVKGLRLVRENAAMYN